MTNLAKQSVFPRSFRLALTSIVYILMNWGNLFHNKKNVLKWRSLSLDLFLMLIFHINSELILVTLLKTFIRSGWRCLYELNPHLQYFSIIFFTIKDVLKCSMMDMFHFIFISFIVKYPKWLEYNQVKKGWHNILNVLHKVFSVDDYILILRSLKSCFSNFSIFFFFCEIRACSGCYPEWYNKINFKYHNRVDFQSSFVLFFHPQNHDFELFKVFL